MKIGNIPHSEPIEGLLAKPAPGVVQPALPVFYAYASTQEENSSGNLRDMYGARLFWIDLLFQPDDG